MSRWDDEDGKPLGEWVEITYDEQQRIVAEAGGLDALTVFATLTDPPRETYTAWGRPGDTVPLVDTRTLDWPAEAAHPDTETYRKFVPRLPSIHDAIDAAGGLTCEQHPGVPWPHDDCAGPGEIRG